MPEIRQLTNDEVQALAIDAPFAPTAPSEAAVAEARRLHAAGATHECAEWQTPTTVCAVCDRAGAHAPEDL